MQDVMGDLFSKSPLPTTDKPIICGLLRGPNVPCISPFVLKLETFARIAKIDYEYSPWQGFSSKSKIPWMIYQGEVVEDSEFCINFLKRKFDVDLDKGLTLEQKATARAFLRLTEENLYWCLILYRYHYTKDYPDYTANLWFKSPSFRQRMIFKIISRKLYNMAWNQGIGRHTEEEVRQIMDSDLKALSDFLGSKPFFMGDEPTEVDCGIFGMLAGMLKWASHEKNPAAISLKEHQNLNDYCDRMRDRFWPDWNQCLRDNTDS